MQEINKYGDILSPLPPVPIVNANLDHTLDAPLAEPFIATDTKMNSTYPLEFWKKLIPNFNKILDHGCWCKSLVYHKFPSRDAVDQLDQICQSWSVCRKCTKETETACHSGGWDAETTIREVDQYKYKCNALDDCTSSLCRCNMNFVVEISQYFKDRYPDFTSASSPEQFTPDHIPNEKCGLPKNDEDLFSLQADDIFEKEKIGELLKAKEEELKKASSEVNSLLVEEENPEQSQINLAILDLNFDADTTAFRGGNSIIDLRSISDPHTIQVPLDKSKISENNDFVTAFGHLDLNIAEKVKDKIPATINVRKARLEQIEAEVYKKERSGYSRGPGISKQRDQFLNSVLSDSILKGGKKCCGHSPNFYLYNPSTGYCDEALAF